MEGKERFYILAADPGDELAGARRVLNWERSSTVRER
jgi:hypothetical protein